MSIASDLRKNILPKQHEQINEIYKLRISNYLSLLAIHGEPNQHIVNNIFNASSASTGGNIDEAQLNELFDQIKAQQQAQGFPGEGGLADDALLFQDYELVDNVRPLRQNIIEAVRARPSYFDRIRKDPVIPKQFEMKIAEKGVLSQEVLARNSDLAQLY